MDNTNSINLLLCGNPDSEYVLPTQIKSILSNTDRYLHVRIITRGWDAQDFETSNLKVEFINYHSEQYGGQPQCNATLDRLFYLKEIDDWDRCILNDWDQLAVKDLGELMDHEFEINMKLRQMDNEAAKNKDSAKDDRADERERIKGSQQSNLIAQKKNETEPKNFESAGNDNIGGDFNLADTM